MGSSDPVIERIAAYAWPCGGVEARRVRRLHPDIRSHGRARGAPQTAPIRRLPRSVVVASRRLGTGRAVRRCPATRRRTRIHRRRAGILDPSLTSQSRDMGKVETGTIARFVERVRNIDTGWAVPVDLEPPDQ